MTLQHKLKRIIEQPSIFWEIANGIKPKHSFETLRASELIGKEFKMLIDVGSSVGDYSKAFAHNFPKAKVISFEPIPNLPATYNIALGNSKGQALFYLDKDKDGVDSSLLEPIHYKPWKIKVEQDRFDNLNIKINRPCLLKIDVEGTELQVLEGFGNKLKSVDVIQVEVTHRLFYRRASSFWQICRHLEQFGFTAFLQMNDTYTQGMLDKSDLLFWRNKPLS